MKKLIFTIVFAFVAIFNCLETKACPPWATNTQPYVLTVNGCDYIVVLCWVCRPNIGQQWLSVDSWKQINPNCNNGLTPKQVADAIYGQLTNNRLLGLCTNDIPPCGQGTPMS